MADKSRGWLALPYAEWRETRDTLHMYTQVIGKLRLALSPFEPGWANVPLYVSARGLASSPVPIGLRTFDAELDLHDHVLVLRSSDGQIERRPLGGAVADFYRDVMDALDRMGIDVSISEILPRCRIRFHFLRIGPTRRMTRLRRSTFTRCSRWSTSS